MTPRSRTAYERYGAGLARGLNRASALVIVALVFMINADVAGRSLFGAPLRGVTEAVSLAIPVIVFLSLAHLLCADKLIRAELLARWLQRRTPGGAAALQALFHAVGALLALGIAAATWPLVTRAWSTAEFLGVEGDFAIHVWPVKLVVVLGSGLLAVFSLAAALNALQAAGVGTGRTRGGSPGIEPAVAVIAVSAAIALAYAGAGTRTAVGAASVFVMFLLVYGGMPVAFALMGSAFLGIACLKHDAGVAVDTLGFIADGAVSEYVFATVPLFVFMGLIVGAADFGRDSLQAAHWLLRRVAGGLGVATVAANAVFAAITGISIASAAIFTRVAVPPLIEHGFTPRFAVGLVAGSSVLGMLIPPSLLLIIYGIVAEVSIGNLFLAAVLPGLLLATAFSLAVIAAAWMKPRFAIARDRPSATGLDISAREALLKAAPVALLIVAVLGGIYGGVFTPTEAGAVGALAALVAALVLRRINLAKLGSIMAEAAGTSASILFLIIAASGFAILLTLSGIPGAIGAVIADAGLGLTAYVLVYLVVLVVLGMVLDSTSILLIMVPLALPTVQALGGDLIWFGVVTVIGVEIGLLTPPLGLSVYAIKSSLDGGPITLNDIFVGAVPFTLIMVLTTLILIAFPVISLTLV